MKFLEKVSNLRNNLNKIPKTSGVYRWWFKNDAAQTLLKSLPLTPDEISKIQKMPIEGKEYWALYFGIGGDLRKRIRNHIKGNYKGSTLRQTIMALTGWSEGDINTFMDDNCYWEWEDDQNPDTTETQELSINSKWCYPLNIDKNQTVSKEVVNTVKAARKKLQHIEQNDNKVIVLNRMYVGDYLSTNLGHEVINMFQADNGNHYIYLNATGNFAPIHSGKIGYMLFVKYHAEGIFEVIGKAEGLTYIDGANATLKQDYKAVDPTISKAQNDYIEKENITYGGVPIRKIFSDAEQQNIFVTFKAARLYKPKPNRRIFIGYGVDADVVLNGYKQAKTSLKTYVYPEGTFTGDQKRENIEEKKVDYTKLRGLIEQDDLWVESNERINDDLLKIKSRDVSIFDICQIQNDENRFSYALAYFMTQPKYKKLWQSFFGQYGIKLGDNYTVAREESAKIEDKNWDHKKRQSGGRIDLLIRDDINIIVIENKIKSDINSIDGDSEGEQLERYYNYVSWSTQVGKPDEGKEPRFIILTPNYNTPHIKSKVMEELYQVITYGDLHKFLKGRNEVEADANFKAFFEAMHRHTHENVNDYLYYDMLEKFVRRIKANQDKK